MILIFINAPENKVEKGKISLTSDFFSQKIF